MLRILPSFRETLGLMQVAVCVRRAYRGFEGWHTYREKQESYRASGASADGRRWPENIYGWRLRIWTGRRLRESRSSPEPSRTAATVTLSPSETIGGGEDSVLVWQTHS